MKIVWTRRAVRHLKSLQEFIAREDPKAAGRVAQRIRASVEFLQTHPQIGRPGRVVGTRELVVTDTPYVIPYRIRGERLELIAIFHGRQKWPVR